RTGFPKLASAYRTDGYSDPDTKLMPRRFEYPLSEKTLNKKNVDDALQSMGGKDDWNNRVWWDMQ
ncbi:MAG: SusD/RagB family nutrient-binding outer membrane lipoprotein, partial [Ferruginibacter sp.]